VHLRPLARLGESGDDDTAVLSGELCEECNRRTVDRFGRRAGLLGARKHAAAGRQLGKHHETGTEGHGAGHRIAEDATVRASGHAVDLADRDDRAVRLSHPLWR
jgi:Mg-chelatase subunit ChlD